MGCYDNIADRLTTLETVLCFGRKVSAALGAYQRELGSALQAEFRPRWILMLTAQTLHVGASTHLISEMKKWTTELSPGSLRGQVR